MNKISFTDTTLRDGPQSLWATRMRIEDMLPIIEKIDNAGYASVEVWGTLENIQKMFQKDSFANVIAGTNISWLSTITR